MGLYEQRTPDKLTIVKSRMHGWWVVTVYGRNDYDFPTWKAALRAVQGYLCGL